jgi:hypothetical protein
MRLEERVVWRYFAQIAEAVAYMHSRRIIHRDLKPANVFLTLSGAVKVGDLGLGRLLSADTLVAHSKVGTPLYMAPECLKGGGHEYAADVWSLGCILYELAAGASPFKEEGLNLYGLFQKITSGAYAPLDPALCSPQLRDLVTGMLAQDPAARPDLARVVAVATEMRAATAAAAAAQRARAAAAASGGGGGGGEGEGEGEGGGGEGAGTRSHRCCYRCCQRCCCRCYYRFCLTSAAPAAGHTRCPHRWRYCWCFCRHASTAALWPWRASSAFYWGQQQQQQQQRHPFFHPERGRGPGPVPRPPSLCQRAPV